MNDPSKYPGHELTLFQHAIHWKKYFAKKINRYIKGKVLEAGAGIGSTTQLLNDGSATDWLMLEPDLEMFKLLQKKLEENKFPQNCRLQTGTTDHVSGEFDTIIYIDVLEHINADAEEIRKAASLLNKNGHLIVLSPAFQHLFSPFDKAIGHCRRYNKKMLRKIVPADLNLVSIKYYDSVGYFASLMNKTLLHQNYPTQKQVNFWDSYLVPVSKITDKIIFHSFGKSIIAVWRKQALP